MNVHEKSNRKLVKRFRESPSGDQRKSYAQRSARIRSHFKLVVVTDTFSGVPRVRRHQTVNGILKDELAGPIHALSMETLTMEEWERKGGVVRASPDCLGGSKHEH